MKSTAARKLAEEFINVLKYNPELTHDEKILSLELRLDQLISDVEKDCGEVAERRQSEKVIVDDRPFDIPPIAEMMIARQAQKGPAN